MENTTDGTHAYSTNDVYGDPNEIQKNLQRFMNKDDRITFKLVKANVNTFFIWTEKDEYEMKIVRTKLRGVLDIEFKPNEAAVS